MEVRVKQLSNAERESLRRYLEWLPGRVLACIDAGLDVYVGEEPILDDEGFRTGTSFSIEVWETPMTTD